MSSEDHPSLPPCAHCNAPLTKPQRCSKCRSVYYCSRRCQAEHWKSGHHRLCKQSSALEAGDDDIRAVITSASTPPHPLDDLVWLRGATIDEATVECVHEGYHGDTDDDDDEEDGDCCRENMRNLREFLSCSSASASVVQNLHTVLVEETIESTVNALFTMWESGRVSPEDQRAMDEQMRVAEKRAVFLVSGIVRGALRSARSNWKAKHSDLVALCRVVLETTEKLFIRAPHDGMDLAKLLKHFQARDFLTEVNSNVWSGVFMEGKVNFSHDEFFPIFRRLAMMNIFDRMWNRVGSWNDVMREFRCNKRIPETDDALENVTEQLRRASNSMRCKLWNSSDSGFELADPSGEAAPQCWEYQAKCSAMGCSNLETSEKPHELRCRDCWYFHWCSETCKTHSCDLTFLHNKLCDATPPDKADLLRKQVETLFGWDDDDDSSTGWKNRPCDACGVKEDRERGIQHAKCGRCRRARYCSPLCQKWAWSSGGHSSHCKKRAARNL